MNFQDTSAVFGDKTDAELKKQYWLFRLLNNQFLTGILSKSAEIGLKLHLPIKSLIKKTIFKHFCGGESIEDCAQAVHRLSRRRIKAILDYAVEEKFGEEAFELVKDETLRTIKHAKDNNTISVNVFKVTGVVRSTLLEKVSAHQSLNAQEQAEWHRAKARVTDICAGAQSVKKPIFIDGEESWVQEAIDLLVMEMMEKFNREQPLIFNTIQLYRHDRLEFLKKSHAQAKAGGYLLAVKLVRGAYMEKERERAIKFNYPSPIQPDKQATDQAYNEALRYCIENIDDLAFCVGSHNEESIQFLAQLMCEKGIKSNHEHILFAQLYGMGDNFTYVLAKNNYNVSKLIPYGNINDLLPYLIRRARENTSVLGQMSRELHLLTMEMHRRNIKKGEGRSN